MSPGNVVGDTSDTKSRYEFTAAPQNVKHKKTTIDDFNSITTTSHPPPQNPPPLTTLPTTTHHRYSHEDTSTIPPPPPPPPLNHNSFLNPLNDNSSTSFSNPIIVVGSRVHNRAEPSPQPSRQRAEYTECYKTWVHHGEPDLPPPLPVIDNTRQPQMSDMTSLLNDLSYIPSNNEHNEPTQGNIGETSNEPNQATRNEFEELYASANEELHPGCDYVTRLDFMAKFTYFKVKGKLIDSIFNEMLEFFQNVFPISKGYKLLPSYYAIKTLL
ncbi:hypothetical protein Tco_1200699 [Tanacetum coccineum]